MVCAPVRSIIPSLKLGDYLSVQAHNPCSISHLYRYEGCTYSVLVHPNAKLPILIFFRFIQERMGEPRFYSMEVLNNVATMEDLLERRYLLHFSFCFVKTFFDIVFCLFVCLFA